MEQVEMWAGIVGRSVAGKIDNCSFNGNIKGKARWRNCRICSRK